LVPIKNGTEEMKSIMARNLKASPKTNPELKKKMEDHFNKYGARAKDQMAFLNGIETEYNYPVNSQKVLLNTWWLKKAKEAKKITVGIKLFFTSTKK